MAYRRGWKFNDPYGSNKVKVTIMWDQMTNSTYQLSFTNIPKGKWDVVQATLETIKAAVPFSQREYDPTTKIWHFGEAHFQFVKDLVTHVPDFEVIVIEKPAEIRANTFIPKEQDYERFKQILQLAGATVNDPIDKPTARRMYLLAAKQFHPDIRSDMAEVMTELNSVYSRLKENFFKEEATNA